MNTTSQQFKAKINGQPIVCNPNLKDFELVKKASTNVDYFGLCRGTNEFFIQFSNGKCFLYRGVPIEVLEGAKEAESIGKFFHANIKGKYAEEEVGNRLIVIDDLAGDEEEESPFGII